LLAWKIYWMKGMIFIDNIRQCFYKVIVGFDNVRA
jgi:hypothetical protein